MALAIVMKELAIPYTIALIKSIGDTLGDSKKYRRYYRINTNTAILTTIETRPIQWYIIIIKIIIITIFFMSLLCCINNITDTIVTQLQGGHGSVKDADIIESL